MMINKILVNNKIFNIVCKWDTSTELDYDGHKYPIPKNIKKWNSNMSETDFFVSNLINFEKTLDKNNLYEKINDNCLLCNDKNIGLKKYLYENYIWFDNLKHYIKKHNISPPEEFVEFIYNNLNSTNSDKKIKKMLRLNGKIKNTDTKKFIKLKAHQLLILDALMEHGGYSKKYSSRGNVRYSEHAGVLDFHRDGLDKIIVSGDTTRIDRGDEEIFLPKDLSNIEEYEYLFHTHPPTPKPGGRVVDGILYEFPSIGDIFHFIDKHNLGNAIGSLVMTSEGLYNIRCLEYEKKLNISEKEENLLYKEVYQEISKNQLDAIKKYGTDFNNNKFYKEIAQDKTYINNINKKLEKYNLYIDFFPRKQNESGTWIVFDIHLMLGMFGEDAKHS